ncbi:CDP-diacylglycerol--glycerol-3-phosphate 3-phosphatidyltransferase [Colletotrichum sp. SAR11_239]|nr:CDP-diacylglycerol--glycerol-3-phosphate 3-phosphatidyltransferase [Colletotrichum sp. SAR11_239]
MIVRGVSRCSTKLKIPFAQTNVTRSRPQCRRFAMPAAGAPAASSSGNAAGMLAPFANELDKIAPSFSINGSQIRIIKTPTDFYETLKVCGAGNYFELGAKTDSAIGADTQREEQDLLVNPVYRKDGERAGVRKKYIPKRINEGWGLQHMKLYGIDDEIILSGANLSNDYFTNRQDRYHLFSSKEVTEYFWNIYQGVAGFSFLVEPSKEPAGFVLTWPKSNPAPSPLEEPKQFISTTTPALHALISPRQTAAQDASKDTKVYMLAQLSQLMKPDTSTELPAVTHVLSTLALPEYAGSSWTFTAGYFNPAPSLTKLLLSTASQNNVVITASQQANGFYGSSGVSGLLPGAYTLLARRFVRAVHERKLDDSIVLKEWRKGTVGEPKGWTYHAKGLWITLPGEKDPSISVVGSSNYTKRSYSHDLEAGAMILTKDEDLKKRLGEEQTWLQEYAERVTREDFSKPERRVGLNVRIAMWIAQAVGGAL